jgi:hypothetical protein
MNDRIHRFLDGELDRDVLSADERIVAEALAMTAREVKESLQRVPAPDLTDRIMQSLPERTRPSTGSRARALFGWLWKPRAVQVAWRPAYGFALAVGLIALMPAAWSMSRPAAVVTAMPEPPATTVVYVQFRFEAAGVSSVALAGSFTGWTPGVVLSETSPGVWSALVPLEPGVYDYTFVIDGERWLADPTAPAVDDGFGGVNSRLFLTRPADNA